MNAKYFQDYLNGHGLLVRITDERQLFDTYKKSKDIAGIMEAVTSGFLYDEIGNKIITYQIEFWGDNKDFDAFSQIVKDYFPNDTNEGNYFIYSQPLTFPEWVESGGNKKFVARLVFQIVEVIGGVSGKSTTLKVDNVAIDWANIIYRQDKTLMPTKAFGINKEVALVSEVFSVRVPMSENAKNIELITAGMDDSYNASYEVAWTIGGITKTFTAVLRVGLSETRNSHEPLMWTLTFERSLPRESWEVALWHIGNFWDVSEDYKPADETHNEEITTEQEFREFLGAIEELDNLGYVVKNTFYEDKEWQSLGGEKAFVYLGISDGTQDTEEDVFVDVEPLTWARNNLNPNDYALNHKIGLYYEDTDETYLIQVQFFGWSFDKYVYDVTLDEDIYTENDFLIYLDTNYAAIDQEGYVIRVKSIIKEWEFIGSSNTTNPIYDTMVTGSDNRTIVGRLDFMLGLDDPTSYNDGEFYRSYYAGGGVGRKYWYARLKEKTIYWYGRMSVDGFVFYGTVKSGGSYGTPFKLPVIDYTEKRGVDVKTRQDGKVIKAKPNTYATGITGLFLMTESSLVFLDDHHEKKGNKYQIKYSILGKTYTFNKMMVAEIDRQNTENANQIMQVAFMEGED